MFTRDRKLTKIAVMTGLIILSNCYCAGSLNAQLKPYEGGAKEIETPGAIFDVVMGGSGRYLLLHLRQIRKIAIYDADKSRIVKFLPVASNDAVMVAGADKLIVVHKKKNLIERWSLTTFEREAVRPLPFVGVVKTISLGYASSGPILFYWAPTETSSLTKYTLVGLKTLKEIPDIKPFKGRTTSGNSVHIRASADGQTFGLWDTSSSPQGMESMVVAGNQVHVKYEHASAGHICPNANGTFMLTGSGRYALDFKAKINKDLMPFVPTTHPDFYLAVPAKPGVQRNMGSDPFKDEKTTLLIANPQREVGPIDIGILGKGKGTSWASHDFTLDKRVHLIVDANQVVTIPFSNDRLLVSRLSISEELKKHDIEHLFVASTPPSTAKLNVPFEYQMRVVSSDSEVELELSAAPEAMTMTKLGLITWQVPANAAQDVDVIVTIRSDSGKRNTFHTFRLKIKE